VGSVIIGLDNGGTKNNATVLDTDGRFLVDRLVETPSRVLEGPDVAVAALVESMENILTITGVPRSSVTAVGLDTPGPASADGVISSKGSTNFSAPAWRGYDIRSALQERIGLPVVYNNDANAAALYAQHVYFGDEAANRSSVSAIVGTGLGGGIIEQGRIVRGASGMAAELGHVQIPMDGLLDEDQPSPHCNCGLSGDAESIASLSGIENNLLPYWLGRHAGHELHGLDARKAAMAVRGLGERNDPLARIIFTQQAIALGRLFSIAANFTDPHAYFVGGGVVEANEDFRNWILETVRANTVLREEQQRVVTFAVVPDLDMAGARGAALAARDA
jgi:glucokinase